MSAFDAKADTPDTSVAAGDKFPFGDVSADQWNTITAAKMAAALVAVCDDLNALKAQLEINLKANIAGTLAQFGPTTSAELAGVLTDETGFSSGAVAVFSISPILTGAVVVRQTGGTAGTDQLELSHSGTNGVVTVRDGGFVIQTSTATLSYTFSSSDAAGFQVNSNGFVLSLTSTSTESRISTNLRTLALNPNNGLVRLSRGETNGATLCSVPLTPAQITADTANYWPGGVGRYYRLSTDASRRITGLTIAQVNGQECEFWNVGSNPLVLAHEGVSPVSNSTDRFVCTGNADITLSPGDIALLRYDSTTSRWRVRKV